MIDNDDLKTKIKEGIDSLEFWPEDQVESGGVRTNLMCTKAELLLLQKLLETDAPVRTYEMMSNFYDVLTARYHVIEYDEEGYIRDAEDVDKYNFMRFFEDWYNNYPDKAGNINYD